MISYLEGKIILKKDKFIILQVNNIGYTVFLSSQTLSRLQSNRGSSAESGLKLPEIGSDINPVRNSPLIGPGSSGAQGAGAISNGVKLFCYQHIKEDASDLYGFLTYDELDFFEVLMDIHGVGPKAALEISALGPLERIKDRILAQDEKIFDGIPGIGAKKAMTIILELTGKIKLLSGQKTKGQPNEAEAALTQLGFSKQQAKDALSHIPSNIKGTEEKIKYALKILGKS